MTDSTPTTDLSSKVGLELPSRQYKIEPERIKRFTEAVGDPNPLWQSLAPPMFVTILSFEQFITELPLLASFGTLLHGKTELEFCGQIKPGDILTATTKISDIRQRRSETGNMAFITLETGFTDQSHKLVARCQQLLIGY